MCGIIGYTGRRKAMPVIMQGLKLLEYRGYDSSGIVLANENLQVWKQAGKLANLEAVVPRNAASRTGLGHTRWATHGGVTEANAHPHLGSHGRIAIVHNGIIDNYRELRQRLGDVGHVFVGQTDSEVIAHLVEDHLVQGSGKLEDAVLATLAELDGTWGLAVVSADHPGIIVAARNGSPLVIGVGDKEVFLASDPVAFAGMTRQAVYLADREIAILSPDGFETRNQRNEPLKRAVEELGGASFDADKGNFPHFFLKEIHEQPEALDRALGNGGRLDPDAGNARLGGLGLERREFFDIDEVVFVGMGSALNAAASGARLVEAWSRLPSRALDASELNSSNPVVRRGTLYVAVSQSGETMDTITATREIINRGGRVIGIVNSVGSTLARLCGAGIYIHAGHESSVASSKAVSNQIMVMALLALQLGRTRHLSLSEGKRLVNLLQSIPALVARGIQSASQMAELAAEYVSARSMLFLGRGALASLAAEGALKVKELSYIHAEAYAAGSLKHGPLALVSPEVPSVFLLAQGENQGRTLGNMSEVRARGGRVICLAATNQEGLEDLADHLVRLPELPEELAALVILPALQFFAYHLALLLDRDIDRPRNLAKSVTTE